MLVTCIHKHKPGRAGQGNCKITAFKDWCKLNDFYILDRSHAAIDGLTFVTSDKHASITENVLDDMKTMDLLFPLPNSSKSSTSFSGMQSAKANTNAPSSISFSDWWLFIQVGTSAGMVLALVIILLFSMPTVCWVVLAGLIVIVWQSARGGSASSSSYSTKRPLNSCSSCHYTWYPRGHNVSCRCPRCG